MDTLNLLGSLSRVETPYVKVVIGQYVFGVFDRQTLKGVDESSIYKLHQITYPNYIQSLQIKKINGQVNTYTLSIKYPITQDSDPNFFEKVFSSVSQTRKITFSYGDLSVPNYIYKDEVAVILDVKSKVSASQSVIDYTVTAISNGFLATAGRRNFAAIYCKPSDRIRWLLSNNNIFGLQDVFFGMRDMDLVNSYGLIPSDDVAVQLEYKENITVLDYLMYLVKSMVSTSDSFNSNKLSNVYTLVIVDDTSGVFGGPYFKIVKIESDKDLSGSYHIDIGYPSENIVTQFSVDNNETYSLLYNYSKKLIPSDYTYRVDRQGKLTEIYSPIISSGNELFETTNEDKTWWSRVTEFPITATITLKGLLRPAILMTSVYLNVYFYGNKFISSGLYVVTQQQDSIGVDGFKTTLTLLRVSGSEFKE